MKLKPYKRTETIHEGVFDFLHIADKIKKMTARNAHGEALEFLAKTIGFNKFAKIFEYINKIHDIEGHVPQKLGQYRDSISAEMNELALKQFGQDYLLVLKSF